MSKSKTNRRPEFDRQIFTVLHHFRGWKSKDIADKAGLSTSTVTNLRLGPRHGGTRFPQHHTIFQLLKAAGYRVEYRSTTTGLTLDEERQQTRAGKANGVVVTSLV